MRSLWWRRGLWVAGFACLWLNVIDDPPLRTGAYLVNVSAGAATVAKITAAPTTVACVVFDADGQSIGSEVVSVARRRHQLRFDGLSPGTRYGYRLTVDGGAEERGQFRTAPTDDKAPLKFAFLGDSGGQPWWVWLQHTPILHLPARWGWFPDRGSVVAIGAAVAAFEPDFVLHLGDVVYPKGQHAHYFSGFFRPFAEVLRNAPIYPVLGNHDVMDAGGQQVMANLLPPAGPLTGDGSCFSIAYGPVRIITLNCNTDLTGDRVLEGHPAIEFLDAELARCTEPWIVVASHFPIRSASRQGNTRADLMLSLLPRFQDRGISLYLSGHDHCYQRFKVDPGAGAVPLVVSGGGGKDLYAVRPDPHAQVLVSEFHWCSAEVRGATLVVTANGLGGATLDRFDVALPGAEVLEGLRQRLPERAARIERMRP